MNNSNYLLTLHFILKSKIRSGYLEIYKCSRSFTGNLLNEIQRYIHGEILYIPCKEDRVKWGEKNGSRQYYENRNSHIKQKYNNGGTIEEISQEYGLSFETIRKIIYKA